MNTSRGPVYITEIDNSDCIRNVKIVFSKHSIVEQKIVSVSEVRNMLDKKVPMRTLNKDESDWLYSAEVTYYGNESITTAPNHTEYDNLLNLPILGSQESVKLLTIKCFDDINLRLQIRLLVQEELAAALAKNIKSTVQS